MSGVCQPQELRLVQEQLAFGIMQGLQSLLERKPLIGSVFVLRRDLAKPLHEIELGVHPFQGYDPHAAARTQNPSDDAGLFAHLTKSRFLRAFPRLDMPLWKKPLRAALAGTDQQIFHTAVARCVYDAARMGGGREILLQSLSDETFGASNIPNLRHAGRSEDQPCHESDPAVGIGLDGGGEDWD